jgi:hypothetical protein
MNVQVREFAAARTVQTSAPAAGLCAVLTAKAERGRKVSALPTTSRTPTTSTCLISGVENLKSEGGENGKR